MRLRLIPALAALATAGCAAAPAQYAEVAPNNCRALFEKVDVTVQAAGAADAGLQRIADFPHLRSNRFLASYRNQALDAPRLRQWLREMRRLDQTARVIELANLAAPARERLSVLVGTGGLLQRLQRCGAELLEHDLADPQRIAGLREQVRVPPSYYTGYRVLGLYPLAVPFLKAGIRHWHASIRQTHTLPPSQLPVQGRLVRYASASRRFLPHRRIAAWLAAARENNPLGLSKLPPQRLQALFAHFAPIWEVDTVQQADRIGAPYWGADTPQVNTLQPVVYRRSAWVRHEGQVLLQLVYLAWFPARPAAYPLDPYAGRLDGVFWRVTLDAQGGVLAYDTIHSCGCFYQLYPGQDWEAPPSAGYFSEPVLALSGAPAGQPVVLRLTARSHYLLRVYAAGRQGIDAEQTYTMIDYDRLRSLPDGRGGRRSLFGDAGLIPASARLERFYLWPSGVPSPGAMRQWGQHAISFVGQRHFDDPRLLEELLRRRSQPNP